MSGSLKTNRATYADKLLSSSYTKKAGKEVKECVLKLVSKVTNFKAKQRIDFSFCCHSVVHQKLIKIYPPVESTLHTTATSPRLFGTKQRNQRKNRQAFFECKFCNEINRKRRNISRRDPHHHPEKIETASLMAYSTSTSAGSTRRCDETVLSSHRYSEIIDGAAISMGCV